MKKIIEQFYNEKILFLLIAAGAFAYAALYFNYFEVPPSDFISQLRIRAIEYAGGNFPGTNYKMLPLYPLILAFFSSVFSINAHDPVYVTAIIINGLLYIPYLYFVYQVCRIFLKSGYLLLTMVFFVINSYTVFLAVNSEMEMVLSLLVLVTIYFSIKHKNYSYFFAFCASITKWDSVFTIPAAMYNDFFIHKKRIKALLLGALSTSGVALWFFFNMYYGSTYVKEIAHQGPNYYMFVIDSFLTTSSFAAWMGKDVFYTDSIFTRAVLAPYILLTILFIIINIIWGIKKIIGDYKKEIAPLIIFFTGFLIIHIIYQNSKSRYVLPSLWMLFLFCFYGIAYGFIPAASRFMRNHTFITATACKILAMAIVLFYFLFGFYKTITSSHYSIILSTLIVLILLVIIITKHIHSGKFAGIMVFLLCGSVAIFIMQYTKNTMDHYSYRRLEFKEAGEWLQKNILPTDKILIANTAIPLYYRNLTAGQMVTRKEIKSAIYTDFVKELADKQITYVYVDDFYLRRLNIKDNNAVAPNNKTWLFKAIRDIGESSGNFRLQKTIEIKGGIRGYIYKIHQSNQNRLSD